MYVRRLIWWLCIFYVGGGKVFLVVFIFCQSFWQIALLIVFWSKFSLIYRLTGIYAAWTKSEHTQFISISLDQIHAARPEDQPKGDMHMFCSGAPHGETAIRSSLRSYRWQKSIGWIQYELDFVFSPMDDYGPNESSSTYLMENAEHFYIKVNMKPTVQWQTAISRPESWARRFYDSGTFERLEQLSSSYISA